MFQTKNGSERKSRSKAIGFSNLFLEPDNDRKWLTTKVSLVAVLCFFLIYILYHRNSLPFPSGIYTWVDGSFLGFPWVRIALVLTLLVLCVLYVMERGMIWVTLLLFVWAVVIFSIEESNGNTAENGVFSLVFFAQFFAYAVQKINPKNDLYKNRLQFTAQVYAAAYTLAALSKLGAAGLDWFMADAPRFAGEVLRVHYSKYIAWGDESIRAKGVAVADFIVAHPLFTRFMLASALLLELCSFLLMLNKRIAFVYTLLLLCMHLGFYVVMGIFFPTIVLPLLIIFVNPLYGGMRFMGMLVGKGQA